MDLLIDIAFYGVGAVALIVVLLALIGFIVAMTASVQALRLPEPVAADQCRSAIAPAGTNGHFACENLLYPSRTFEKASRRLIDAGSPFTVTVPAKSRRRAVVERQLPAMVHYRSPQGSLLRDFVSKLRTMALWACVADATVNHKYAVSYTIAPVITIRFDPPPPVGRLVH